MSLQSFLNECSVIRDDEGYSVHLRAKYGELPSYAITCGSPERVRKLMPLLEDLRIVNEHRGLLGVIGNYKGVNVFAVASGMGSPTMAIIFQEWLFNTDIENEPNPTMIRVGSSGSWNEEVGMNDIVISNGIVRDDGASQSVSPLEYPGLTDMMTTLCLIQAAKEVGYECRVHLGPTICKDNLYADEYPEGHSAIHREIRDKQTAYERMGVLATSMESGPPSVLASLYREKARRHGIILKPAYACELVVVSPYYGKSEGIEISYDNDSERRSLRIASEALRLKYLLDHGENVLNPDSIYEFLSEN